MKKEHLTFLIILMITLLLSGWSVWYWQNYPPQWSGSNDKETCDNEMENGKKPKSIYCIGFGNGYNWAWTQMQIDKNIENEAERNSIKMP